MPRPNQPRSVDTEAHVARNIRREREQRGLTYERLAEKMTEAGCPMHGSAVYKIENSDPPRRITVNELVTFARVFGVALEDLLVPVEVAARREMLDAFKQWSALVAKRSAMLRELDEKLDEAAAQMRRAAAASDQAALSLRAELATRFGASSHWVDDLMTDLTGEES